jgi:hypothetical protein
MQEIDLRSLERGIHFAPFNVKGTLGGEEGEGVVVPLRDEISAARIEAQPFEEPVHSQSLIVFYPGAGAAGAMR